MNNVRKYLSQHVYLFYTLLFVITCIGVFVTFLFAKKSFIWIGETKDGLVQHYNSLMYFGRYLRYIVTHLEIPMWDFSFGYGADILSTLHYYCIGDPLNLLSVFVPSKYTEYLYDFLVLFRLYLAGGAFMLYCRIMNKERLHSVIGALVYVFCGYALFASVRHPYFINPMIYLPLMLIGVEKIYRKSSPLWFILSTFLAIISNFYFFYILCVVTIVYTVIRFFDYYHHDYLKNILQNVGYFLLYGIIAVLMSSVILIPVLNLFMGTSRSQDSSFIPLLYGMKYYVQLFFSSISVYSAQYWSYTHYPSIILITTSLLFLDKTQKLSLKIGFIFLTVVLCVPFLGSVFNGFSYVTNRWIFAYSMLLAYILVAVWPTIYQLNIKKIIGIISVVIIYCLGAFAFKETNTPTNHIAIFFLIAVLAIMIVSFVYRRMTQHVYTNAFVYMSLLCLVIVNIFVNARLRYDSDIGTHYVDEFIHLTSGYRKMVHSRYEVMDNIQDDEFYRVDEVSKGKGWQRNAGLQTGYSTLSFFYSLGNGYISEYFKEMENVNYLSSAYNGIDYRTFLNTLASAKYFISPQGKDNYVPYGYRFKTSSSLYKVYENQYALPLGYTYDHVILENNYQSLTPLQKQEALLQGAVVAQDDVDMKQADLNFSHQNISYHVTDSQNIEISDQKIKVKKDNSQMKIKLDHSQSGELYFCFQDFQFLSGNSQLSKVDVKVKIPKTKDTRSITLRSPYNSYYNGTKDYTVNLGYYEKTPIELSIQFAKAGEYQLKDFAVYVQPMNDYKDYIQSLKEDVLQNVQISSNQIVGNIHLTQDKLLCLTIPYSKGWKAIVDGKETELKRVNTMYMGLPLSSGSHSIQLVYTTPGLKIGIGLSVIGMGMLGGCIYLRKKKKLEKTKKGSV